MIKNHLRKNDPRLVDIFIWTDDIEYAAIEQIIQLSTLPILFNHISVMPDAHAGKGSTVGTVIATTDALIPAGGHLG